MQGRPISSVPRVIIMHGNLSSCAESVFIAARRPRGVARERENGEERVASNPERQLNPCTRPRPFLHNTYVQPRRRLRTSPTPVAKGAKRVCVTAAFADDPLFSPPCLEKSFPNDRCDIFRGRKGRGGRTESERSVEGDRSTFLETESGTFLFFQGGFRADEVYAAWKLQSRFLGSASTR